MNKWKRSTFHKILFVLTVIVTLSKVHWGGIAVFSIFVISIDSFRRTKLIGDALFSLTAALAFFATYLTFIHGAGNAEEFYFSANFYLLSSILIFVATRLVYSVSIVSSDGIELRVHILFFSNLILMVLFIWLTNSENNTFYFYHSMIVLSAIVITPNIFLHIKKFQGERLTIYVFGVIGVSVGIGSSIVYLYLRYRLSNKENYPLLYWLFIGNPVLIQPLILLTVFTTLGIGIFLTNCKKEIVELSILVPLAFLLVLGSNFGTWLVNPLKPSITNIWQDVSFSSELVFSDEQVVVGNWIRNNTPADSLVASSFQCSPFELINSETAYNLECSIRNTLSWIVPLSRRSALLESVTWFQGLPTSPERLKAEEYIDAVDRFARLNDPQSVSNLRQYGVNYVVIDRVKTATTSWAPNANVVFVTKGYFVLEMVET